MRLSLDQQTSIKKVINNFDSDAKIYLFGSRVDPSKRGGDIDLLVISKTITEKNRREIKLKFYDELGEQKIDLIIADNTSKPFIKIALEQGILL